VIKPRSQENLNAVMAEPKADALALPLPSLATLTTEAAMALIALVFAIVGLTDAQDKRPLVTILLCSGLALALTTLVGVAVAIVRRRAGLFAAERQISDWQADRAGVPSGPASAPARPAGPSVKESEGLAKQLERTGAYELARRAYALASSLRRR
jgi:hypothetical protein